MLPAAHRLRASADFATVNRSGHRARRGSLVVYLCNPSEQTSATGDGARPTRAGLIVGKKVGGSVVRHRVSRRLRAQLASRLGLLPAGATVVVRALPEAAQAGSTELGHDLEAALRRLRERSL